MSLLLSKCSLLLRAVTLSPLLSKCPLLQKAVTDCVPVLSKYIYIFIYSTRPRVFFQFFTGLYEKKNK